MSVCIRGSNSKLREKSVMINGKLISKFTVIDPDSQAPVEVEIYKLNTGGIVGIDASFLATEEPVYSPFDKGVEINPETFY